MGKLKLKEKSGYDDSVGIVRAFMIGLGIWPGDELKISWRSHFRCFFAGFLMVFFVNIPQTRMLFSSSGDLNAILDILITADIMVFLALLKLLGIWWSQKDLRWLIIDIAKDWKVTKKNELEMMWPYARIIKLIMTSYFCITYGTFTLYTIVIWVYAQKYDSQKANSTSGQYGKPLFFTSKFYFNTDETPIFECIFISQCLSAAIGLGAFVSFDGFFTFSILHVCSQLNILQENLKNIIARTKSTGLSITQSLGLITERHIHLRWFTNSIEDNFNKIFLVQMICYSITLGLQGYQVVTILTENMNIADLVYFVVFATANMSSLFMYCLIAEALDHESSSIFHIVYEIDWMDLKPKESMMLIYIMHASRHPFTITAGKFAALNFEYFAQILKTAMGYLSMLLAVKSSE